MKRALSKTGPGLREIANCLRLASFPPTHQGQLVAALETALDEDAAMIPVEDGLQQLPVKMFDWGGTFYFRLCLFSRGGDAMAEVVDASFVAYA